MSLRIELRRERSRLRPSDGPWIRRAQIRKVWGPPDPAALACVTDHRGRTLAWGLYGPESEIVVRLLTFGEQPPPENWLADRIAAALRGRAALGLGVSPLGTGGNKDALTTGVRMINTEGDGLPGLVADRYGEDWVLQVTTAAMVSHQPAILNCLKEHVRG
ncbi:MAG TPA: hypothetical protein ENJ18_07450, partial [Nannocystis exedens]|nr:hypothetical protein [Nannocystis exedens]